MPRASVLLSATSGPPGVAEADIRTTCPSCGRLQRLDEALYLDTDPLETFYCCADCAEPVLVVATAGVVPWEERGTQIGDWVIRNPTDVLVRAHPAAAETRIPAAPHAFE